MTTDMAYQIEPLIPALRRYGRALVRDRTAADDLVQDCLERAISRWHQRRSDGDTRSWIFAILHNLAMTRLNRTAKLPQHMTIETVDENLLGVAASQEDRLRYQELLSALAQLPDSERSVLLLVGVEDLSYAETAKVLDIPIGTVMSRLSRARARLFEATCGDVQQGAAGARAQLRRVK
jgi:RNA polymerase sigma-70 factor (ECF subfamily)